ncbi:MAG: YihY/virulence factor BrkB family protein [Bacteroidota bacterium]
MAKAFKDRLPGPLRTAFVLLQGTIKEFGEDKASRLSAALAYYAVFSLAPLLLVVIAVVGFFWGAEEQAVQARMMDELSGLIGTEGASVIRTMLESAADPGTGIIATIAGIGGLLWGSTRLFAQLQGALNDIWNVAPNPERGIMGFVSTRILSFGMVLVIGLLMLMALVVSALLSALRDQAAEYFPASATVLEIANYGIALALITLLFAAIYRYLPDVEIAWRDVWVGALITAILFSLGKYGISVYIGSTSTAGTYGAAGSFVVLLLWVYFSSLIFFFGAEFTQVFARHYGHRIEPSEHAVRVEMLTAGQLIATRHAVPSPAVRPGSPAAVRPTTEKPQLWKRALPFVAAFIAGAILFRRD